MVAEISGKAERLLAARERFAPPPRVHVVVRKEDIDSSRLDGRVVIVLDILFATTTIVTALDAGATAVHFAEDQHEARRIASQSALSRARVGRIVLGVGGDDEIRHATEIDASSLVATVDGDRVVARR